MKFYSIKKTIFKHDFLLYKRVKINHLQKLKKLSSQIRNCSQSKTIRNFRQKTQVTNHASYLRNSIIALYFWLSKTFDKACQASSDYLTPIDKGFSLVLALDRSPKKAFYIPMHKESHAKPLIQLYWWIYQYWLLDFFSFSFLFIFSYSLSEQSRKGDRINISEAIVLLPFNRRGSG